MHFLTISPSDYERIFCALLCSAWPAQRPQECGVCNRQERINEWKKDAAGETSFNLLICFKCINAHMISDFMQTRTAMVSILEDLHEEDHFAVIQFDTEITSWKESLAKATKENVADAVVYVKDIRDRGG